MRLRSSLLNQTRGSSWTGGESASPFGLHLTLQPFLPDALHVTENEPAGVGVHAVDDHLDGRAVRLAQLPGKIGAQMHDGLHGRCIKAASASRKLRMNTGAK